MPQHATACHSIAQHSTACHSALSVCLDPTLVAIVTVAGGMCIGFEVWLTASQPLAAGCSMFSYHNMNRVPRRDTGQDTGCSAVELLLLLLRRDVRTAV